MIVFFIDIYNMCLEQTADDMKKEKEEKKQTLIRKVFDQSLPPSPPNHMR